MPLSDPSLSTIYFVSLGCPKNLVDSQVMLGLLERDRYQITTRPEEAEVIIVNTCSFIEASKEESIETILDLARHKTESRCKILVASGCLPQRYTKELEREMPEVDLFIGTGQYHRITEALATFNKPQVLGAALPPQRTYIDQPAFIHSEKDPRMQTGPSYTAYLKISEGCNRRCSFCIIPKLRGNVRSRSIASLVEEAKTLAACGARELNLVAQDLTEYGMERKYQERLETLLPELCKVDGIRWIRLHYVYPDQFSDELIEVIVREPKIVKYIDMPIQHTNDRLLKLMNRRLTKEKLFDRVARLREEIPEVVFRTSIIVGFPGEAEEEFQELCDDLDRLDLDRVGVFRFSKEEGTPAALLPEQVSPSTKRKREKHLIRLLESKALKRQQQFIGKIVQVFVEGPCAETDLLLQGRMPSQAPEIDGRVLINDTEALGALSLPGAGDFVEVEVTDALPYDLVGRALRRLSP